VDFPRFPFNA